MKGQRPDFIALSARELEGGQTRWKEVGVAFKNEKSGTISISLDAVPLSGRLVLKPADQGEGPAAEKKEPSF
jgi:hypothetical protein